MGTDKQIKNTNEHVKRKPTGSGKHKRIGTKVADRSVSVPMTCSDSSRTLLRLMLQQIMPMSCILILSVDFCCFTSCLVVLLRFSMSLLSFTALYVHVLCLWALNLSLLQ